MYTLFLKEIKSLYRQLKKTHKIVQLLVAALVLCVLYYFLNPNRLAYSWRLLSNVHYGREGLLSGQPKTLVYYHMEGCPYCKKFDPNWDTFKTKLANSNCSCEARKVDSKDEECQKNGVQGFPTILLTDSNKDKIKECPTRDPDEMLAFCKANE